MFFRLLLLALLSALSTILYVRLGRYVLRAAPKRQSNRVFFLISLCFAVWSFAFTLLPSAPASEVWFWFKLSALGWTLMPSLLLHLLALLAGYELLFHRRWIAGLVYVPGILFFVSALAGPGRMGVAGFVQTPWGWSLVYGPWRVPHVAFLIFATTAISAGFWLVYRRGTRASLVSSRRQSQLVVFSGVPVLLLVFLSGVVLPWLDVRWLPEIPHLFPALWLLAIYHAVSRYSLMAVTPAVAAEDILRTMGESVLLLDTNKKVVEANAAAEGLLMTTAAELTGRPIEVVLEGTGPLEIEQIRALIDTGDNHSLEFAIESDERGTRILCASSSRITDERNQLIGIVLMLRDVTQQKRVEEELRFTATHDALTGLPNRIVLEDRLDQAVKRAQRSQRTFAVMTLDLDDFKKVNDSYGHAAGDSVLREVSRILLHSVRGIDTVCRLSGDEFLVVLEDLAEVAEAEIVICRIREALAETLLVGNQKVTSAACIGVSFYPEHGETGEALLSHANLALYSAKGDGKGQHRYFTSEMEKANSRMRAIERGLERAVAGRELFLEYQPMVDLHLRKFMGVEALLRWRSPELGLLQPDDFIATAERTGQIVPIGNWVLREACRQNRRWLDVGLEPLPVSVNISARQLHGDDLVGVVAECLEESELDPVLLELELTESVALDDIGRSEQLVNRLVELGVRIVIDDFGAGQSSLTRLRHLPMHAVKIDRSFIRHITTRKKDRDLVTAIIAMARELKVQIISEGVESTDQMELLQVLEQAGSPESAADRVQGFLFSRPVAPEVIRELRNAGVGTV